MIKVEHHMLRFITVVIFILRGIASGQNASETIPWLAPESSAVLVAAHRGGYETDKADRAPENSVANVEMAIQKGYDVFETDIQRTADGMFVIVHDATIERELTGTGAANTLTLAELKKLKKRYRDGSVSDEPIATLEELLITGRGRIVFKPDLKPGVIEHFDDLARLIIRLGMKDQVLIRTPFKDAKVIQLHFLNGTPKVEVMFKLTNAKQVRQICSDFSPLTLEIKTAKGEVLSAEKRSAIEEAMKREVLVETHSYSDEVQWEALAKSGVRMFHTASPAKTLRYLKANGWRKNAVVE